MRTARRRGRATVICFLAGALLDLDVRATPADIFGIGPRTQATGGTGAAWDAGSESAFVNPATLALTNHSELTLGVHDATFSLDVDGGRDQARFSTPAASGVLLGVLVPLRIGEEPIALGLFSRSPSDVIASAHLPYPETPQFPLLANRVEALDLSLGLGICDRSAAVVGRRAARARVAGRHRAHRAGSGTADRVLRSKTSSLLPTRRVSVRGSIRARALRWRSCGGHRFALTST